MSPAPFIAFGLLAALAAACATALARRIALRRGFLDHPAGRKDHRAPMPLLGGAAIILPLLLGPSLALLLAPALAELVPARGSGALALLPPRRLILELAERESSWTWLALSTAVVFLAGLWDDLRGLRPRVKLVLQVAAAAVAVRGGGITLSLLPTPLLNDLGALLWIVTLTNAFNFLDNMDGLLAGLAVLCGSIFAVLCFSLEQYGLGAILVVYAGAALGFLPFNFPRARIFMGDAGSMPLGHLFGALGVQATYVRMSGGFAQAQLFVPLALAALPLLDLVYVVLARWCGGVPVGRGDHRHISHRFVGLGWSRTRATVACWVLAAVLGALASALPWCDTPWGLACLGAQIAVFAAVSWRLHRGRTPLRADARGRARSHGSIRGTR